MKKIIFHTLLFCCVVLFSGCATPYNPFKSSREEIIAKVKTIGMMPVQIVIDVEAPEAKKKEFENEIIRRLEAKDYKVIPPDEYKAIYEPLKESMGAMYDPHTGKLLEEKKKALQEHARREYLSRYDVDAILRSGVIVVKASWHGNHASWDGTKEASTGKKGIWADLTASGWKGTIPALSVAVVLQNRNRENYFVNYGGIQLYRLFRGGDFIDVPKHQLLADSSKNINAVAIALNPLLNEPVPK
jgi:hypothetical protein